MLRHRQFADIVQQRRRFERLHLERRKIQFLAHRQRVNLHSLQVLVRRLVLGLDGQRQRFNRPQVKRRHTLRLVLLRLQSIQVQLVGPEYHQDDRDNQKRHLPAHPVRQRVVHRRHAGPQQIVGEAPEVAIAPHADQRLAFGQRHHYRYQARIEHEEQDRRRPQRDGRRQAEGRPHRRVVADVARPAGNRHTGRVEQDVDQLGPLVRPPETLHQARNEAQHHGFSQRELYNPDQRKQEVHRHRAGHVGEGNLEPGTQRGDHQVHQESGDIRAIPRVGRVRRDAVTGTDHQPDVNSGGQRHCSGFG